MYASVGRWQKGKDLQWWNKAKGSDPNEERRAELARIKKEEQILMDEAMCAPSPPSFPLCER